MPTFKQVWDACIKARSELCGASGSRHELGDLVYSEAAYVASSMLQFSDMGDEQHNHFLYQNNRTRYEMALARRLGVEKNDPQEGTRESMIGQRIQEVQPMLERLDEIIAGMMPAKGIERS